MSDQDRISRFNIPTVSSRKVMRIKRNIDQGVKLIFFSDSHLATKFFKVVANAKKVGRHF